MGPGSTLVLHVAGDARALSGVLYHCGDGLMPVFTHRLAARTRARRAALPTDWDWPAYPLAAAALAFRCLPGPPRRRRWPAAPGGGDQAAVLFVVRGPALGELLYKIPLATYNATTLPAAPVFTRIAACRAALARLVRRPGCGIGGAHLRARPTTTTPRSPRQTFATGTRRLSPGSRARLPARILHRLDLDRDPGLLHDYRLLLSVGHDEYGARPCAMASSRSCARRQRRLLQRQRCAVAHPPVDHGAAMVATRAARTARAITGGRRRRRPARRQRLPAPSYRHGGGWWDGAPSENR